MVSDLILPVQTVISHLCYDGLLHFWIAKIVNNDDAGRHEQDHSMLHEMVQLINRTGVELLGAEVIEIGRNDQSRYKASEDHRHHRNIDQSIFENVFESR